jgi:hypothetical protein
MNQRTFHRPFVDTSTVAPYFSGRRPFPRYAPVKDTQTIDAAPEGRNTVTGYTPMRWQAPPHPPVSGRWPAPMRPLTRLSACHPVTTPWRPSECLKPFKPPPPAARRMVFPRDRGTDTLYRSFYVL